MIESMNKEISSGFNDEEIEVMISELTERNEFACTGNGCAAKGCGVN